MTAVPRQSIRQRLIDPSFYPEEGPVEVRETHISVVFLTPRHAWKLLKPVRFDFLDFSTPQARRIECHNELRLNRRLAPDVYLQVVGIVETGGELRLGGEGTPVEWVLKMRRLPDDATLQARLHRGTASEDDLDTILDVLIPFFESAARGADIAAAGDVAVIRRNLAENLAGTEDGPPSGHVDASLRSVLRSMQFQYLATHETVFRQRVEQGWIRDGHGDLRAEHVYLTEPAVIVDCIAFNDRFRHADVLDEICFLATDLRRLGRDDLADALLARYRSRMHDPAPDSLTAFFQSYRYGVRAKVACLRASEHAAAAQRLSFLEANSLLARGVAVLRAFHRPFVIVMCGVSGSGKSTVARCVSARTGAVHLASDAIRKELYGVRVSDHSARPELYGREANERTYAALCERAADWLRRGASLVLDATFAHREDRARAQALAAEARAAFLLLDFHVPADVAAARLRQRQTLGTDVSDAGVPILERQLRRFEAPEEIPARKRLVIGAGDLPEEVCRQIVSRLVVV